MTEIKPHSSDTCADPSTLWRSGAQALRSGDPSSALSAFKSIIDLGWGDATVWLGVAIAQRALGDEEAHALALDQVLSFEPRNIRALVMRADHYSRAGDAIAAASFFRAAARLGAASQDLDPGLAAEVGRAEMACAAYEAEFESHLRRTLAPRGIEEPAASRVAASLDLMFGRKQIYLQQPSQHYFPGLPQIEFYQRSEIPWLDPIEAATNDIRKELVELLKEDHLFQPYIEREKDRPFFDGDNLLDNRDWSALYLWKNGEVVEDNARRCPKTMAAVAAAPLCRIPGRTPSVLFSLLRPGARIPPHHGFLNSRLICHLPLIVPDGCSLRVGNEVRTWRDGEGWLFDDSIEHEAWNNSDKVRVILLFDVWRPELTDLERELVAELLSSVSSYSGAAPGSLSL